MTSGKSPASVRASCARQEGPFAIVTNVGAQDAMDACHAQDERMTKRTAKSCGPDVSTLTVTRRQHSRVAPGTGTNSRFIPGEHSKPQNQSRRECRIVRWTVADCSCAFFTFAPPGCGELTARHRRPLRIGERCCNIRPRSCRGRFFFIPRDSSSDATDRLLNESPARASVGLAVGIIFERRRPNCAIDGVGVARTGRAAARRRRHRHDRSRRPMVVESRGRFADGARPVMLLARRAGRLRRPRRP